MDIDNFLGPWAGWQGEAERKVKLEEEMAPRKLETERKEAEEEARKKGVEVVIPSEVEALTVTTKFFGKEEFDYQGRSWVQFKAAEHQQGGKDYVKNPEEWLEQEKKWCFLPKKCIHTFTGHKKGVQTMRLFPDTGHLVLSAGQDGLVKIWDFYKNRALLRDYMGHTKGVKDIRFAEGGSKFYSCGFDKKIHLWDTESGKIVSTFSNGSLPYCLSVHPQQPNIFVAGCSNKKAVEWDSRTGEIVQEYAEHLGTVHSVTFCDEGKKLVTTADDRRILIWEHGIPVVVKQIADPNMHAVPTMTVDPSKKFICGQSMDNRIVTYEAAGKFKFVGSKKFVGHKSAGHSCEIAFSPDSQFISSGDGDGKVFFWNFKNRNNLKVLNAHTGDCTSNLWHPHHTSKLLTCGNDGLIKLWD